MKFTDFDVQLAFQIVSMKVEISCLAHDELRTRRKNAMSNSKGLDLSDLKCCFLERNELN